MVTMPNKSKQRTTVDEVIRGLARKAGVELDDVSKLDGKAINQMIIKAGLAIEVLPILQITTRIGKKLEKILPQVETNELDFKTQCVSHLVICLALKGLVRNGFIHTNEAIQFFEEAMSDPRIFVDESTRTNLIAPAAALLASSDPDQIRSHLADVSIADDSGFNTKGIMEGYTQAKATILHLAEEAKSEN